SERARQNRGRYRRPRACGRRARAAAGRRLGRRGDARGPSRGARRAPGTARPLGAALRAGEDLEDWFELDLLDLREMPCRIGIHRGTLGRSVIVVVRRREMLVADDPDETVVFSGDPRADDFEAGGEPQRVDLLPPFRKPFVQLARLHLVVPEPVFHVSPPPRKWLSAPRLRLSGAVPRPGSPSAGERMRPAPTGLPSPSAALWPARLPCETRAPRRGTPPLPAARAAPRAWPVPRGSPAAGPAPGTV